MKTTLWINLPFKHEGAYMNFVLITVFPKSVCFIVVLYLKSMRSIYILNCQV